MQNVFLSKRSEKKTKKTENIVYIIPLFWIILGIIEVFSSSRYASELLNHSKYYLVSLHIAWIVISFVLVAIFMFMSKKAIKLLVKPLFWINILLLIFTFINGKVNGASRWVSIFGFTLQPSEFLKIIMPLYLVDFFENLSTGSIKTYQEHLQKELLPFVLQIILPLGLVLLQPDLSTFVILAIEAGIMYFLLAKNYLLQDILIISVVGIILLVLAITLVDFRKSRLMVYTNLFKTGKIIDPYGAGNQILNILIAVGSGGLLGKGIGHSSQVGGYLVESTAVTDSIAAVLFEELGFVGGSLIVLSYVFWGVYTIHKIMQKETSPYSAALISIVFLFTLQALIHFAVNVGFLPLTGVALPFMSYGGSSTLVSIWMLVLLFSFFEHT